MLDQIWPFDCAITGWHVAECSFSKIRVCSSFGCYGGAEQLLQWWRGCRCMIGSDLRWCWQRWRRDDGGTQLQFWLAFFSRDSWWWWEIWFVAAAAPIWCAMEMVIPWWMKLCSCEQWFRCRCRQCAFVTRVNGGPVEGDECTTAAPGEVERELYRDDGGVTVASAGTWMVAGVAVAWGSGAVAIAPARVAVNLCSVEGACLFRREWRLTWWRLLGFPRKEARVEDGDVARSEWFTCMCKD